MARPKITNADVFVLERNLNQDGLKTTTEHCLSQSTIGASTTKVMNFNGVIDNNNISLEYTKEILEKSFKEVARGDLSIVEQMLMNLSFKAQNQSRATLDSIVQLKRPIQTTFVKQANISQGHQQVNNLGEKNITPQNELLEDSNERMDGRTQTKSKRANSTMETLVKVDGSKNTRRKEHILKERN
jgi:hypothetical protein